LLTSVRRKQKPQLELCAPLAIRFLIGNFKGLSRNGGRQNLLKISLPHPVMKT
jgi:hypothetical protein